MQPVLIGLLARSHRCRRGGRIPLLNKCLHAGFHRFIHSAWHEIPDFKRALKVLAGRIVDIGAQCSDKRELVFTCAFPLPFQCSEFARRQGPQRIRREPQSIGRSSEGPNLEPVILG